MRGMTWVAVLASLALSAAAGAADTFGPHSAIPEAHSFTVGKLQLTALHDAQFVIPNDGKTFGVGVDPTQMSDLLRAAGAPTDRITLSINALLVRTGHRLVLIDTGFGPKMQGSLFASLQEVGVKPSAVTDVLITHSHGDHTGGLVDADGHLAFPKATIHMAKDEWAYMQSKGSQEAVKTIASHVKTFDPGTEVAPGITAVSLKGHTPGHVGYEISSGNDHLLDIGDLAHSSIVSLQRPQWTLQFDGEAAVAKGTRLSTLKQLASDQELVFAPHFPFPGLGHVEDAGDGFVWKPVHE